MVILKPITIENVRLSQTRDCNHVSQTHGGLRPPAAPNTGEPGVNLSEFGLSNDPDASALILNSCPLEWQNKLIVLNGSASHRLSSLGTDVWTILSE